MRGLRRHEAEVVAGLQIVEVLVDLWVIGNLHAVGHTVEFVESLTLHGIAEPTADIALLVDPGEGIGNIEVADTVELVADLCRGREGDILLLGEARQGMDELKDVRRQRLGDA